MAAMVDDWLAHRENADQVLMLATERATVAQLNQLARAHLVRRGQVHRRSRTYRSADDSRTISLGMGDEVILRRNGTRLAQPGGRTVAVRNGMTGRITRTDRRSVTIQLDADHIGRDSGTEVTLPATYVGANVDYAYARTVDTAQGATVDHSLFAPSAATSAERAYVALSRAGSPTAFTPPAIAPGPTPSLCPAPTPSAAISIPDMTATTIVSLIEDGAGHSVSARHR